tara:strand:- start:6087 stop:7229 length:1143 start_codon:yes stop_codon:yes gene_type:complete
LIKLKINIYINYMSESDLYDCSNRNLYPLGYSLNHGGYLTGCITDISCNNGYTPTGKLDGVMSLGGFAKPIAAGKYDEAEKYTKGKPCYDTSEISVCGPFHDHYICKRNDNDYGSIKNDNWTKCCNNNTKLNVGPNDCHPLLYNENNKPSQRCVDICMQNSNKYKNISGGQTTTLKNDYLNGSCHDIIKSNKDESELREFCSKSPAWSDSTGPNASYSKICGCYYPDKYYENLKKIISDKTKIPEDMLGDKRCFSSLCSNSEMTDTNCPDLNILTCINNVNFNGNVNNSGNININQTENCKQKYSDMSKGKSPGAPGSPGDSTFTKTIKNFQKNNKTMFIVIIIVSISVLLLLIIGIIVAIKRKKVSSQMSTNIVPQFQN